MTARTKTRILVVEDDPANQMLARTVLEEGGYEVHVATTSDEALHILQALVPALILMDVELPGRDGLSLTRLLKSMSPTTGIPVVAMTAHATLQQRQEAIAAGCIGFITKPFDVHTLASRVAEFLTASEEE